MAKVTLPMVSMSFKDVNRHIELLHVQREVAEENRLLGKKDILRAKVTDAEQELIKSTILFFSYLDESNIKF